MFAGLAAGHYSGSRRRSIFGPVPRVAEPGARVLVDHSGPGHSVQGGRLLVAIVQVSNPGSGEGTPGTDNSDLPRAIASSESRTQIEEREHEP